MTGTNLMGDLISRSKLKLVIEKCPTIEEALQAIDNQPTEIPDDYYRGFQDGLEKQLKERSKN